MARQPQYLHADALIEAIRQASGMLEALIERVEVVGSMIHVEAGGRRLVFRISQSDSFGPGGEPMLGGTSGEAVLVSGPEAIIAGSVGRWWGRLTGALRKG